MSTLEKRQGGFTLIEVLVSVTILALTAISAMSLSGYHKVVLARVEKRFALYNMLDSLSVDLKYILSETDEKFPYLGPEAEEKRYEGTYNDLKYNALMTKVDFPGRQGVLKLEIMLEDGEETADTIIFLINNSGEINNEDT